MSTNKFSNYKLDQLIDYYIINDMSAASFSRRLIINKDNLLNEVLEKTKFLDEYYDNTYYGQRLYHIWNNNYNILKCSICNNPCKYNGKKYLNSCNDKKCINKIKSINIINTNLNKYGVKNVSQCEDIIKKKKQINLDKYGTDYFFKTKEFKDKNKQTCLNKYGVQSYSQTEEYKEKYKNTCFDKYGVENSFQSKEVQKKSRATCLERYGVEYILQDKEIFENNRNSSYRLKSYILPSGKEIKVQGYEDKFLDEYFSNGGLESNILIEIKDIHNYIGIIYYNTPDGKKHRYYPDFYLLKENKIVEVKSEYTIQCNKEINVLKKQICLDKGLNFEYKIY